MEETKSKHPGGRPQHFTKEQIQKFVDDFTAYIEQEEDPTIVGFTSSYPAIYSETLGRNTYINKDFINDREEFSELRKRAIQKQERYLLDGVTKNKLNATMGIFRLKQPYHGYTDRVETVNKNINYDVESMTDEELKQVLSSL